MSSRVGEIRNHVLIYGVIKLPVFSRNTNWNVMLTCKFKSNFVLTDVIGSVKKVLEYYMHT